MYYQERVQGKVWQVLIEEGLSIPDTATIEDFSGLEAATVGKLSQVTA